MGCAMCTKRSEIGAHPLGFSTLSAWSTPAALLTAMFCTQRKRGRGGGEGGREGEGEGGRERCISQTKGCSLNNVKKKFSVYIQNKMS